MSWTERVFKLQDHGTTVRTEIIAGVTTFLTMAYIIFVNPAILGDAGMPKDSVFVATCLIAALGTAVMALYANYPIALAPGMGLNAYFAYTVVLGMGFSGRPRWARCSSRAACSWRSPCSACED
jgi:AGZA family xanthine/uracil permease-like MFS transporter